MTYDEDRLCEAIVRQATFDCPEEFCEATALEGSDYCEGHDPEAAADAAIEREEARRLYGDDW